MDQKLNLLAHEAAEILVRKHSGLLPTESIHIDFRFYRGARRIGLNIENSSAQTIMEFFVDIPDIQGQQAIDLGLDFLDGVLHEYLSSNRESTPRLDPAPYQFEGHTIYLSGGMRRPALEAAADALLEKQDQE